MNSQFVKQVDDSSTSSHNGPLGTSSASWLSDGWLHDNDDMMYASLLFDEQLPWSESDNENFQDEPGRNDESNKSLREILADLNTKINYTIISKFNISRSRLWEGAVRGLSRKQYSPENKVSVKFTDDIGNTEGAVDSGGTMREFFTLTVEWIVSSQLFSGNEREKYLSCNSNYNTNDYFFRAGQIIAMSIVHYDALTFGVLKSSVDVEDVYDFELKNSLSAVKYASTIEEANGLISSSNLETIFDLARTLETFKAMENITSFVKKAAHWFVLERFKLP